MTRNEIINDYQIILNKMATNYYYTRSNPAYYEYYDYFTKEI